ncbi:uncharacterized protein LAESUDRAFT_746009 [Laetiporus sulphureus 93-53]|uniref:Ubiquinol-cytochrome C reductase hinge domain-containing protein n=1 Tax=Laetiporus sulphureus 93-53 TaxID=1314785 RepID=A0A165AYN7_9APHY|nr:uncharacterized protein LAESUDRAFT_746009 [Laetiporus sulphureus 93-53]KZS99906.1 hypothetical protein LAESUDRAFT_746009 [Laetiporus sulphureus 93-53]
MVVNQHLRVITFDVRKHACRDQSNDHPQSNRTPSDPYKPVPLKVVTRSLSSIDDDTLIAVFSFLPVQSVLAMRQCLLLALPFPHRELAVTDASELEHCVCRAIRIASSGTGVSKIFFLPGYGGRRIATITKGFYPPQSAIVRKVVEWCPKGMIFTGEQRIEILRISDDGADDGPATFKCVRTIRTSFRPIALEGDMITYSDDSTEIRIMDLKSGALAILRSAEEPVDQRFQYDRCLQVVFAYRSILVVRARSVELFEMPVLRSTSEPFSYHPLANHSFGWIDNVSVKVQACPSDTSNAHTLDLYTLEPNPQCTGDLRILPMDGAPDPTAPSLSIDRILDRSPYLFPPAHSKLSSPSVSGILRCTDIILGPYGTAVWIQPHPAHSADLTTLDVHANGDTSWGSFAGLLQRAHLDLDLRVSTLWAQLPGASHWTSLDYVEELGLVAIGSSDGRVVVLELVFRHFCPLSSPVAHADAPEEKVPEEEEAVEEKAEEEEEPEDIMPALREECENSARCLEATKHFQQCEGRANSGKGFDHEDCIEEFWFSRPDMSPVQLYILHTTISFVCRHVLHHRVWYLLDQ